ncbi:hypothetical protein PoB_002071400 [Plakobranchus ocellatus]|uniref:Uncharacterized protein n=1 Tax=Plakobranchus ocellatus TaxID=259542 RepID=A0AAV3ZJY8_9GAST|nr:hypothetical protein PoB_002071400 [Plakobranchus ocellatus]
MADAPSKGLNKSHGLTKRLVCPNITFQLLRSCNIGVESTEPRPDGSNLGNRLDNPYASDGGITSLRFVRGCKNSVRSPVPQCVLRGTS